MGGECGSHSLGSVPKAGPWPVHAGQLLPVTETEILNPRSRHLLLPSPVLSSGQPLTHISSPDLSPTFTVGHGVLCFWLRLTWDRPCVSGFPIGGLVEPCLTGWNFLQLPPASSCRSRQNSILLALPKVRLTGSSSLVLSCHAGLEPRTWCAIGELIVTEPRPRPGDRFLASDPDDSSVCSALLSMLTQTSRKNWVILHVLARTGMFWHISTVLCV